MMLVIKNNVRRSALEFEGVANEIDVIFESYTELHAVYTQSFESIFNEFNGAINNTERKLLENKKTSISQRE